MALFAVLLSCCGWLCPDFGILRKGFTVPEQPGPLAWFILVSWYVLVFVSLSLGQRLGVLFTGERSGHGLPPLDPLEFVRTIAVARITMPRAVVRLSAGREDMSEETQALCFLAGANSIFYGPKLLTTPNPERDRDRELMEKLGLSPMRPD